MGRNHGHQGRTKAHKISTRRIPPLYTNRLGFVLLVLAVILHGSMAFPLQDSAETLLLLQANDTDFADDDYQEPNKTTTIEPIQHRGSTTAASPGNANLQDQPVTIMVRPRLVTDSEWKHLTAHSGPLITEVAFDMGRRVTPKYAYVTAPSYRKFIEELDLKCRKTDDTNIAEIRLNNFDAEYFEWEEFAFNGALVKRLFPETSRGDHSRFLDASSHINKIRLGELENHCEFKKNDDSWSDRVDEKTRFEDFLINTIFRPRFIDDQQFQTNSRIPPFGNYTENAGRKRRETMPLSPQQSVDEIRMRIREYRAKGGF